MMTGANKLLFTLLLALLTSCGSLHSFKSTSAPLILKEQSTFTIKSINCNTQNCISTDSDLHNKLKSELITILQKSKLKNNINTENSDYSMFLISAFEQEIDESMPRNIYLIIQDHLGNEVFQLGIAESFSTPLTKDYISLNNVEQRFKSLLNSSIVAPRYVAKVKR